MNFFKHLIKKTLFPLCIRDSGHINKSRYAYGTYMHARRNEGIKREWPLLDIILLPFLNNFL